MLGAKYTKKINYSKIFFSPTNAGKTKFMCLMSMNSSTEIVKFVTLGSGVQTVEYGQCSHILKMN